MLLEIEEESESYCSEDEGPKIDLGFTREDKRDLKTGLTQKQSKTDDSELLQKQEYNKAMSNLLLTATVGGQQW